MTNVRRPMYFLVLIAILASALSLGLARASEPFQPSVGKAFRESVDLSAIRLIAVQDDGRVKTFDSLARERLKAVNSSSEFRELDAVLIFLDMVLMPEHYATSNVILIAKQEVRAQIVQGVRSLVRPEDRAGPLAETELERIVADGLVSPQFLDTPVVRHVLNTMARDLMRTARFVDQIQAARAFADAGVLLNVLRVVPPAGGHENDLWRSIREANDEALVSSWATLSEAWRFQDSGKASAALMTIADHLARIDATLYPSETRRSWEHFYYRSYKLQWAWIFYFAALPFLLIASVYRVGWARWTGIGFFALGFLLHTAAIGLRWWLAGRIPNANMFEAITASAWLGGVVAIVLELVLRRWPLKNFPALAASAYAMTAMMIGSFMPVALNSDITTVMPVLDRTIWLYIHTNIIIASYALIFCGSVTALLYLVFRALHEWQLSPRLSLAWEGAGGMGRVSGGASSLILGRGIAPGDIDKTGLARALDGSTMIFMELSFITLWIGTILGAVWADVSWGRPWGWDPKEVFALNTWLVFLVLVHVRLRVKDKAFWTAILALIGCAVMIFNWIAVNFVIVGLHSYA